MFKLLALSFLSLALYAQMPITPIPQNVTYDKAEAQLGRELFFYPITKESNLSCVSCHDIMSNGTDNRQYSLGANKIETDVNTATIYNASYNFVQHFNGAATDLKSELLLHVKDKNILDTTLEDIVKTLSKTDYKNVFTKVYKDGLTKENFVSAIVEFERSLTTPNSKFDNYLRGDVDALNKQEKRGFEAFKDQGCIYCHNGVNVGGNMYQKMGIFAPYKQDKILNGKMDISKRERDKFVYKVPTLRNIELTSPYMHDGSVKTLKEAVTLMREHQLGLETKDKDIEDLLVFLKTLTGEKPEILKGMK